MSKTAKKSRYSVNSECVICGACADVAPAYFAMPDGEQAFVIRQPETNEAMAECQEALDVCPVGAIEVEALEVELSDSDSREDSMPDSKPDKQDAAEIKPVFGRDNVRATLELHPELKPILAELSPKFKRLQNPAMYNTVARFASFHDAARLAGISICTILHRLNDVLGVEASVVSRFPECVQVEVAPIADATTEGRLSVDDAVLVLDLRGREGESLDVVLHAIETLQAGVTLAVRSSFALRPLEEMARQRDFVVDLSRPDAASVLMLLQAPAIDSVQAVSELAKKEDSAAKKDLAEHDDEDLEILDVREMTSDPFDLLIQQAYRCKVGEGFILVQSFKPDPLINMLEEMNFSSKTEQRDDAEFRVIFRKKEDPKPASGSSGAGAGGGLERAEIVIQSATPVAYPILMRLLQSQRLRERIVLKELKVWEETEKHLAWIVNGRADVSFSALITGSKLPSADIVMPAALVWDNFTILTRDYEAKSLADLQGHDIATPLFKEAPPAGITRYLLQEHGLDPDTFNFVYGQPFGRPREIMRSFMLGAVDTVILREPEASFALQNLPAKVVHSELPYTDLWNQVHPGFGSFPNATIVVKRDFIKQNKDVANILLEETRLAIDWVNENKKASAEQCADIMHQHPENVLRFLQRVNFDYVDGEKLEKKAMHYMQLLFDAGVVKNHIGPEMFRI